MGAVMDYCALSVRGEVERFHVLYLDRKNRLTSDVGLGVGTVDHVPVYPREVVARALHLNASAVILVHNHPSGDPSFAAPIYANLFDDDDDDDDDDEDGEGPSLIWSHPNTRRGD